MPIRLAEHLWQVPLKIYRIKGINDIGELYHTQYTNSNGLACPNLRHLGAGND
jgi:hypothetical protein